jgi:LPXTG-site transpeptidase (sortase) family protein
MRYTYKFIARIRYYTCVVLLYVATLFLLGYSASPLFFRATSQPQEVVTAQSSLPEAPAQAKITYGKPVRIVIPRLGIDLPVDDGVYNPADKSWTLSKNHAHFALLSSLANDKGGSTFIYGHNNKLVFGSLHLVQPGDIAQIYTENGHMFTYKFQRTQEIKPEQVTVLDYQGPPVLTVQTCSGTWYENRQIFSFTYEKIENGS